MAKVCRICGKKILGDILKHYQENHFAIYAANRTKIQEHPGAFVVRSENFVIPKVRTVQSSTTSSITDSSEKPLKVHTFDEKKMKEVCTELWKHPREQTYRDIKSFRCDACGKFHYHGKVIFRGVDKSLHLCYECYKYAKKDVKFKRGNRHFFISTPMK